MPGSGTYPSRGAQQMSVERQQLHPQRHPVSRAPEMAAQRAAWWLAHLEVPVPQMPAMPEL